MPLPKGDKGPPPVATIVMQTDDNAIGTFASAWPDSAYRSKTPCELRLNCDIDRYGLAEWCEVLSSRRKAKALAGPRWCFVQRSRWRWQWDWADRST